MPNDFRIGPDRGMVENSRSGRMRGAIFRHKCFNRK